MKDGRLPGNTSKNQEKIRWLAEMVEGLGRVEERI